MGPGLPKLQVGTAGWRWLGLYLASIGGLWGDPPRNSRRCRRVDGEKRWVTILRGQALSGIATHSRREAKARASYLVLRGSSGAYLRRSRIPIFEVI